MRRAQVRAVGVMITAGMSLLGGITPVMAAGDDVKAISVGNVHACALKSDGKVWCWGDNQKHQMGDGTDDDRPTPVRVERPGGGFLKGIGRISPGTGDQTCAVKTDGTVRCWGQNDSGELGDGTTDPRLIAVAVTVLGSSAPLTSVKALTSGSDHVCALRTNGTVWCWGSNDNGRLGDGTTDERHAAVQVRRGAGLLTGAVAIGAGAFHTCAVLVDTTVRCWGSNGQGQLGDGTTDDRHSAVKVRKGGGGALSGVVAITGGFVHSCALHSNRKVSCWGDNSLGELGDGTTEDRHHPVGVKRTGGGSLTGVTNISAGGALYTCAATTDRKAFCWGDNENGQLGDGSTKERHKARLVKRAAGSFEGALRIGTGGDLTCALRSGATMWCWGSNTDGQVGSGNSDPKVLFPERVDFP